MEFKPKRYIAEMYNSFMEKWDEDSEQWKKALCARNAYIAGLITEYDAVKTLINIVEEEK